MAHRGYRSPVPDAESLLAAYDAQLRPAESTDLPPGVTAEADGPIVRVVGQHRGFISAPQYVGLGGRALNELIGRQQEFFAERGEAVEWKTRGHDRPPDLPRRLKSAGFVPEPRETVLIGTTEDVVGVLAAPAEGVGFRQVTEEADLREVAAMESEIWGTDLSSLADDLLARVETGNTVVLVAEADDRIVSAAWLTFKPGTEFAGLWGGATIPTWRGRGVYKTLLALRARLAAEQGVRYLHVDASDDSLPILEALGFTAVTTTTPYVWTPPPNGFAHDPVTPATWEGQERTAPPIPPISQATGPAPE